MINFSSSKLFGFKQISGPILKRFRGGLISSKEIMLGVIVRVIVTPNNITSLLLTCGHPIVYYPGLYLRHFEGAFKILYVVVGVNAGFLSS